MITTYRRNQEFASTKHSICDGCPSYCCTTRFGWNVVTLTPSDRGDKQLMDTLRAAGALQEDEMRIKFDEVGCKMRGEGGRCTIYSIRPLACRNVMCFHEDLRSVHGPVKTNFEPWMDRLKAHGLEYDASGWPNTEAGAAYSDSVVNFYRLKVKVTKRRHGIPRLEITFILDGRLQTATSAAQLPLQMRSEVLRILRDQHGYESRPTSRQRKDEQYRDAEFSRKCKVAEARYCKSLPS